MKKFFSKFFVIFLICSSNTLLAKETSAYYDSVKYKFNPVVVTATKVQGAQKDLAASVSVIDESIIQNATTTSVLELVKDYVPGVFITEKNVMGYGVAEGAAGGISIRGVGGSPVTGVLVLRDGRPDIMGMMGHPIPDAYSLDGVERIEVVRGPASFLYGTNAMGGVINIVSKKMTEDGFTTRISMGMGSYSSKKLTGYHGGRIGALEYFVTASNRNTDGHRDYSAYDGDFYTAHIGYNLTKSTNIALNANLSNIYMFDPGIEGDPYIDHWYDLRRSGADISVIHESDLGESNFKFHGNFGKHKIYDGWRSNDRTIGVMFYHNLKLRLSAAKGFRSPAIRELYVFLPRNKDLKPEKMWNYEVGLGQQIGSRFNLEGSLFRSEGENMIRTRGQFPNVRFVNILEFTHTGYELVLNWLPIHHLQVATTWTKLDLQNETRETPGKKLTFNVTYSLRFLSLSANLMRAMDVYGADYRKVVMDDYTLLNLSAHVKPPIPYISFKLAVKNILDTEYQTIYGYPMPGRILMFDLHFSL